MSRLVLVCVLLTASITSLNALRCYFGAGENLVEIDCGGSCMTTTMTTDGP